MSARGWMALRLCLIGLLPLALGLLLLFRFVPGTAEWYAGHIFPLLSGTLSRLTGWLPFSVGELLLAAILVGAPALLVWRLVALARRKPRAGSRLLRSLASLGASAGVLALLYALCCGFGYYRVSFADQAGFVTEPASAEELAGLCGELVERAAALSEQVPRDEAGVMQLESFAQAGRSARAAMTALAQQYPVLEAYYPQPKPVLASRVMSYCNITGIYSPFTVEANVNRDICAYEIPVVMCHELSHLSGMMREEEANFIAYLAGSQSDDPSLAYSSVMLALSYSVNALAGADYDAYVAVMERYSEGMRADVLASRAYWKQFEGKVAQVATSVNNSYLQANAQQDGVRSYGRMVDLLLAQYRQRQA